MEINVDVDSRFAGCVKAKWLKSIIDRTLTAQGLGNEAEVSLIVTGQRKIHELNKAYLEEDRPTDVLSFPMMEPAAKVGFVSAPDGKKHLGEVIVSFPQAVLQAEEHGHSVEREISILVVHGLLHLLGYDHAEAAPKREMQATEKEILILLEKASA
ncbi:MAG: rRNA maturation RNase YbeY [Dehalococcoidales bacterium]|nr:rRNA maturation RNase YbeY [Dehalococcoidales bacterium]